MRFMGLTADGLLGLVITMAAGCVALGAGCWTPITANCCAHAYPTQPNWDPRSCNCPDIQTSSTDPLPFITKGTVGQVSSVNHPPEDCTWNIRACINQTCVNTGQSGSSQCFPDSPAGAGCAGGGGGDD